MKVKDSVYDKHGHELFFKDLETLLRHKEPVYNKDAHWGDPNVSRRSTGRSRRRGGSSMWA